MVQAIGNENFDVAIKIDSPLYATDQSTSQGLMVLSDSQNFITFALETDGSKIGLSAHTVAGGVASTVFQDSDFSQYQNPMYLLLTKNGSAYVAMYSLDGVNWTQAASFTNTSPITAHRTLCRQLQRHPRQCCSGGDVSELVRCSAVSACSVYTALRCC